MSEPPLTHSQKMKAWHASLTPEQKAEWREKVSIATTAGMDRWHAGRSEEHKALANQRIADASLCNFWRPRARNNLWQRGRRPVGNTTPEALARAAYTRLKKRALLRVLEKVANEYEDDILESVLAGVRSRPPHSAPYLLILLNWLEGRPREAEPPTAPTNDLSELTHDELLTRAVAIAVRLQKDAQERAELARQRAERCAIEAPQGELPVIDLVPNSASAGLEKR